jgi:excisionase family DNA binding protein
LLQEGRAVLKPNTADENELVATASGARKPRGNLAETLDRTLEPRLAPFRRGRPNGTSNYEWTPEIDTVLAELCTKFGPAKAKSVVGKQVLEMRRSHGKRAPRPDGLRKAIERRLAELGLPTGQERKRPETANAKPWTPRQVTALLACLGGDLHPDSVEARTHHTIKAARAKLARMDYKAHELRNGAYTVDELASMLSVSSRQIRRWKEKGRLNTTRRRISENDLAAFLKQHHQLVPYQTVPRETQVYLLSLGYPAKEASEFQKNVKAVLESLGPRKKRRDAGVQRVRPQSDPKSLCWPPPDEPDAPTPAQDSLTPVHQLREM